MAEPGLTDSQRAAFSRVFRQFDQTSGEVETEELDEMIQEATGRPTSEDEVLDLLSACGLEDASVLNLDQFLRIMTLRLYPINVDIRRISRQSSSDTSAASSPRAGNSEPVAIPMAAPIAVPHRARLTLEEQVAQLTQDKLDLFQGKAALDLEIMEQEEKIIALRDETSNLKRTLQAAGNAVVVFDEVRRLRDDISDLMHFCASEFAPGSPLPSYEKRPPIPTVPKFHEESDSSSVGPSGRDRSPVPPSPTPERPPIRTGGGSALPVSRSAQLTPKSSERSDKNSGESPIQKKLRGLDADTRGAMKRVFGNAANSGTRALKRDEYGSLLSRFMGPEQAQDFVNTLWRHLDVSKDEGVSLNELVQFL